MSSLDAIRATTNRPRLVSARNAMASNSGASFIILLAHSRTASFMPSPWSEISTTTPRATAVALTSTWEPGGENEVPLSTSSATR
ncbi:hypothetical protein KIPE111705_45080 [Kibdelosporangium persicum]